MRQSCIYAIRNKKNGKIYIGSAADFLVRKRLHISTLNRNKHHSLYLQNSWNKHGADAFEFKPLIICAKKDLLLYEQRTLDEYRSYDPKIGYNICPIAGSPLGRKLTEEHKKKLSAALKGIIRDEKWRINNAAAQRRRKPRSDETRLKLSLAGKNRKFPPEVREKIAASKRGKPRSPETIEKMRLGMIGKKHTEEWKRESSKRMNRIWAERRALKAKNAPQMALFE